MGLIVVGTQFTIYIYIYYEYQYKYDYFLLLVILVYTTTRNPIAISVVNVSSLSIYTIAHLNLRSIASARCQLDDSSSETAIAATRSNQSAVSSTIELTADSCSRMTTRTEYKYARKCA